jgi:hypothetical protein
MEGKPECEAGQVISNSVGHRLQGWRSLRSIHHNPKKRDLAAHKDARALTRLRLWGSNKGVAAMKKFAAIAALALGALMLPSGSEAGVRVGGGWGGWCGCCYYGGYYRAYAYYYQPCLGYYGYPGYRAYWGHSRRALRRAYRQSN